jgi:hypothetical protein
LINKDLLSIAERLPGWQEKKTAQNPGLSESNPQIFPQDEQGSLVLLAAYPGNPSR